MASNAASLIALEVLVAPDTVSQLLMESSVASVPANFVLIPFDLL